MRIHHTALNVEGECRKKDRVNKPGRVCVTFRNQGSVATVETAELIGPV
jgi:hypothetical protein